MKIKPVFCWDSYQRKYRIGRVMWQRGRVGDGVGYSVKLSLAVGPRLLRFGRDCQGWTLALLGLIVHYEKSFGGRHV